MKKKSFLLAILIFIGVQLLNAQGIVITGTVTDGSTGDPLPGVNLIISGTTTGTVTGLNGEYSVEVPDQNAQLTFSFIGYLTETRDVGTATVLDVALTPDIQSLSEVVVVGYGSMERTNVTGAITTVKTEELSKAPVADLVEAMRGQVPGVRMTRTTGKPGSGMNFLIRGRNSLNSNEEPLVVMDGVPLLQGNLSEINMNDIESINVLKDAAAASIYGTQGANGVILITTKSGSAGKSTINVNVSQGFTDLVQRVDVYDAKGFVQLKQDAARGAGRSSEVSDVLTDAVELANYTNPEGIQEIDWHDVLLRTGKVTNAGVSVTGGSENVTFYLNGDVHLEDGIVEVTSFDRYSFRLNSDFQANKFVKMGAKIQLVKTESDETGNSAVIYNNRADFTDFLHNTPLGRMYNENNELVPTVKGDQFDYNPLWKYRESETGRSTSRIILNPYVEFSIIKGLTYRINASAEQRNEKYTRFTSSLYNLSTIDGEPSNNNSIISITKPTSFLLDNIITYNKTLADVHNFDATFIYGAQTWDFDSLRVQGEGGITDLITYNAINTSKQEFKKIIFDQNESAHYYYAARLGYNYNRKYVLTGTFRWDYSSIFGPKNRKGFFPSGSFAWNMHDESFLKNISFLDFLKFRLSYGRMGNDRIGSYGYVALTTPVEYPFDQTIYSGFTADKFANAVLQWETSQQFNTGFDFGFLNSKVTGTFDLYRTRTKDLLLRKQIPQVTGHNRTWSNIGETENRGIEISLNYKVLNGNFGWDIAANMATDQNKINRLNDAVDEDGNLLDDEANGWFIGQDIDEIYEYDYLGVWQQGEEAQAAAMHPDKIVLGYGAGDPKIRDIDGNDTINLEDLTFVGNPTPDWYGGIRNTFRYKGLELTILFEAVQGVTRVNTFHGNLTGRSNQPIVDYWTPENPTNAFPEPNIISPYQYANAVRVEDASFIALRNLSLSYTLPSKYTQKAKISKMQVYVRGNNLKYWTDFVAYSPETEVGAYPITKVWTIGTNITF